MIFLVANRCVSSLMIFERKHCALSLIKRLGKLYLHMTCSSILFATVIAVLSFVGTAIKNRVTSQQSVNIYLLPALLSATGPTKSTVFECFRTWFTNHHWDFSVRNCFSFLTNWASSDIIRYVPFHFIPGNSFHHFIPSDMP